jgi:hypothetical protein
MGTGSLELWVWPEGHPSTTPEQRVPLPVGAQLLAGRHADCNLVLSTRSTSRSHFTIIREGWEIGVTDLESRNGTFVNGVRVTNQTVRARIGDWINAGENEIRVIPIGMVDPVWLIWNDGIVARIAESIDALRRFGDLPILHDALLDAGCDSEAILEHLHSPGPHTRGCWVIDLLLGGDGVDYWGVLAPGFPRRSRAITLGDECPCGWTSKPVEIPPEYYMTSMRMDFDYGDP